MQRLQHIFPEVGISKPSKYHIQYLLACQVLGAMSTCLPRTSKYLYLLEIYIDAKTEVTYSCRKGVINFILQRFRGSGYDMRLRGTLIILSQPHYPLPLPDRRYQRTWLR
jgi:hypothetical protein